jgi:hypothetical protein
MTRDVPSQQLVLAGVLLTRQVETRCRWVDHQPVGRISFTRKSPSIFLSRFVLFFHFHFHFHFHFYFYFSRLQKQLQQQE